VNLHRTLLCLAATAALMGLPAWADESSDKLKTDKDRISYTVGVETARNFKKQGFEFDPQLFLRGMQDANSGQKLLLGEKDLRKVLAGFQTQVRQTMAANRKVLADDNRKKAADFIAANKVADGVVMLPSGLQYRVVKAGTGTRKPVESDTVRVEYRGTLLDGTEFDATEPGHPATLRVSQVIAGWKEALKGMTAGAKWQLFVPPPLAYGERGVGTDIGPNELLKFDIELVEVQ
jgi:FKBP-type peptidyl-prolyl cis-trans isomerase FklB